MLAALLLAATAVPAGAEQAERAFAAMAQARGQWTAFRAYAAPDAILFTPAPTNAQAMLAGRADPPRSIRWRPAQIFTACDGSLAVSIGPWWSKAGRGTFTTVWRRQAGGGWKWSFDHGRDTPRVVPIGRKATVSAPTCRTEERPPAHPPEGVHLKGALVDPAILIAAFGANDTVVQRDATMPALTGAGLPRVKVGDLIAKGCSDDLTLCWGSVSIQGAAPGAHDLTVYQRRNGAWTLVVYDLVGVPAA